VLCSVTIALLLVANRPRTDQSQVGVTNGEVRVQSAPE